METVKNRENGYKRERVIRRRETQVKKIADE